eukprot:5170028-Amphidinium_carterae.1
MASQARAHRWRCRVCERHAYNSQLAHFDLRGCPGELLTKQRKQVETLRTKKAWAEHVRWDSLGEEERVITHRAVPITLRDQPHWGCVQCGRCIGSLSQSS